MIRKVATGLLAAVILSTATGCMPSPFAQDVPSTNWQVDGKGNRIKITNPGGGVTAADIAVEKQQVKAVLDSYYAASSDGKILTDMQKFSEENKSFTPSGNPEERKKQEAEMAAKAKPFLSPILDTIDTTGLSDMEQITLATGSAMFGSMGLKDTEIKISDDIVIVAGDTATIDMAKAEMYFKGEKTQSAGSNGTNSITHFVKKDGKWLINGKKLAESMGVNGSSMDVSIGN